MAVPGLWTSRSDETDEGDDMGRKFQAACLPAPSATRRLTAHPARAARIDNAARDSVPDSTTAGLHA
ncbi:hypothetical protein ACFWUZ_00080 [Streptomyces sp. NPDC058646]|uniref:hypothetical protein n=1 Tax=Streptomyces sp. NPDC058646 TaxID=3346574 RepID=UPI00365375B4